MSKAKNDIDCIECGKKTSYSLEAGDTLEGTACVCCEHCDRCFTAEIEERDNDEVGVFVNNYIDYISGRFGKLAPKKTKKLFSSSVNTVKKLITIDKFDLEYILKAVRWSTKDGFWATQIKSLAGVRRLSKNGLTKFQNLANSYEKDMGLTGNKQIDKGLENNSYSKRTGENIQRLNDIELE